MTSETSERTLRVCMPLKEFKRMKPIEREAMEKAADKFDVIGGDVEFLVQPENFKLFPETVFFQAILPLGGGLNAS